MQPKRLENKIPVKEITKRLDISLNTFYRGVRKGFFKGYIFRDALTKWYYYTTEEKLAELVEKNNSGMTDTAGAGKQRRRDKDEDI